MEEKAIKLGIELTMLILKKIEELKLLDKNVKITFGDKEEKESVWITIEVNYCNSKYEDCILFYTNDTFSLEDIENDFNNVISKAEYLLK